jgi:hypothetical protein
MRHGSKLGHEGNLGGGDIEMGYKAGKSYDDESRQNYIENMSHFINKIEDSAEKILNLDST